MLSGDLELVVDAIRKGLSSRCAQDESLRNALYRISVWLSEIATEPKGQANVPVGEPEPPMARVEKELRIGGQAVSVVVPDNVQHHAFDGSPTVSEAEPFSRLPASSNRPAPEPRLNIIAMRCVLKSEAARWAVTRRNRLAEGANFIDAISPTDQTLIARAKALPDCYVWMLDPYGILPPEDQQLGIIDACYTNLADAAELMRRVAEGADDNALSGIDTESVASLVAEAQSALRVVLFDCGVRNDQDQLDAYRWLKEFTFREQIYLRRFMRIEDPASPHDWGDLHDRLDKVREQLDDAVVRGQRRKTLLNKARYHKRKLLGHAQIERADIDDWRKTLEAVDSLVGSGIHASDLELREILLPLIDHLPESLECGKNALLALREVDRYLASRPTALEIAPSGGEYSNEVLEAQELLKNKRVVLIGGDERSSAKESLERALALSELCWVSSKPHQAIRTFEPEVARQETVLVMLAIRWSSHSYTEVKQFCDRYSKLFVRLPGGYGVNQVAAQILAQAGDRLRQSSLTP